MCTGGYSYVNLLSNSPMRQCANSPQTTAGVAPNSFFGSHITHSSFILPAHNSHKGKVLSNFRHDIGHTVLCNNGVCIERSPGHPFLHLFWPTGRADLPAHGASERDHESSCVQMAAEFAALDQNRMGMTSHVVRLPAKETITIGSWRFNQPSCSKRRVLRSKSVANCKLGHK
jgi:hypothetical protein